MPPKLICQSLPAQLNRVALAPNHLSPVFLNWWTCDSYLVNLLTHPINSRIFWKDLVRRFEKKSLAVFKITKNFGTCYKNMPMDASLFFDASLDVWMHPWASNSVLTPSTRSIPPYFVASQSNVRWKNGQKKNRIGHWLVYVSTSLPWGFPKHSTKIRTTLATSELFINLVFHFHVLTFKKSLGKKSRLDLAPESCRLLVEADFMSILGI